MRKAGHAISGSFDDVERSPSRKKIIMERRVVFKSNIDRTIRTEKHTEQDKGEKHRDAELVRDTVQKHTGKDHNGRQEQEGSYRRSPFTKSKKSVFFIVSERKRKNNGR